nr:uncharacterized protein LOC109154905 [Ipomoea trifida]
MVDAIKNGWRDSSGGLSKLTVEKRILPALNEKLGCQRSYAQYQSRLKWFKNRFNNFSELMRHSSGFGWDPITKRFTASDEVWEDYLKEKTLSDWVMKLMQESIKLLSDSLSRRNGLKVPQGKYFLVDCGFPNRQQFLAPYRGVRYHLQDFVGQGRDPENDVELFNLRHASLRNVIERIFGIFKSRFTIFKSAPPFPYKTQAELVLACAGLHNFLRKECRSDEFPIELDSDESPSPLPMNDVDNFEQLFETQEQQREHANEWRAKIALDMWRDTQQGETNANQR